MIQLKNVSFSYADTEKIILDNLSVSIPAGAFVAVVGDNGAGKSTFCKLLNGIIPHFIDGDLSGDIIIKDKKIRDQSPAKLAHTIGYVYQDFENQILRPRVLDDASYGLLNEGEENYIEITMDVLATFDLAHLANEYVWQLSGGQKHLLALAGILVMSPDIIVLDEPIAQLDPYHAKRIYENLAYLNRELNKTIIVIEHNAEYIGKYCNHVLFMKEQKINWFLPVEEALQKVEELTEGGVFPPQVTLLGHELTKRGYSKQKRLPINMKEAIPFMQNTIATQSIPSVVEYQQFQQSKQQEILIKMENLVLEYPRIDQEPLVVLDHLNLTIHEGERIAIIGNNGAGKSSLMKLLVGLLKPKKGQILLENQDTVKMKTEQISDKIGYVYQNAENMFIEDSIEKDIAFSLKARGMKNYREKTEQLLEQFDLLEIRERDGRLLSGGQMRRASLAIGISLSPICLLLDEPTASLDMATRKRITSTLQELSSSIETVVIATHDMQLVSEWASRVIVMHHGRIIGDGTREEIFRNQELLTQAGVEVPDIVELSKCLNQEISYSVGEFIQNLEVEGMNIGK